ncbi:MAG TPA: AAA family ATPase [Solirubrobacteraceae bacterium]|nr:AAA family ATPase [Solirubrobacteraceae bacterium]
MPENSTSRSVKIGADERTGWSSERPRRDGAPPRPVDVSVRSRVLTPSDRMRYSPGSLVLIVGAAAADPERFADRVFEERGAVLSLQRVRKLLAGRVEEGEMDSRSSELLGAAVLKRLQAKNSVVVPLQGFDADEREKFVRMAHASGRPRHVILLEAPRDQVTDEERPALDEFRRVLDANELGKEGFQTSLRLGGNALGELKRIVFQPPPRDD